jgi:predicted ester cyclase
MTALANRDLGRRFFESQDRLKGGPERSLCTPTYVAQIGSSPAMPWEGHEAFAKAFYSAFPDLSHTIDETVSDDDAVTVRFTIRGRHTGDFMGIPPTQRAFEAGAIAILHIVDGKVAGLRGQFDQFGMMRQLGVVP